MNTDLFTDGRLFRKTPTPVSGFGLTPTIAAKLRPTGVQHSFYPKTKKRLS